MDAKEDVGVWVGEGDEHSGEFRREAYCATRVTSREVRSLVGETLREMFSEVGSGVRESNREVYAEILEVRSGNNVWPGGFGVFSKVWWDSREVRSEARSKLAEERERPGKLSEEDDCPP